MNTEALEYFIKVYEKKSVTSAAKDLFITPQGLSKTIKQLELDLQTELFYRGTRGVDATEYGELLYARAKHICYLIEDLKKEISVMSGSKGTLNLVVTYASSTVLPSDLLFGFPKEYPNIQMKLKEVPDEFPVGKLFEDEEVDVGLVLVNEKANSCDYELILKGEVVIVVSKDHHLADRDEISIEELEDEPLLIKAVEAGGEHSFVSKCLEHGFTPTIEYEIGNVITAHMLCKANKDAYVSISYIENFINDDKLKVIKLKEKIHQNIYLVTKKRPIQSKVVSLFKNYVDEHIKNKS
ncbi:MAG: LysR family transcriptional regulator [Clostridium sp.]|uniref:HTH-type transcriptional regulator CysL n=1 Tax=Clostridium paraputrificum TaxID=29363 RepID=A0A6N3FRR0_9CLOT|nr:LysR family transcriptional regulator [Clostridium sp.]MBS5927857.1 LysR family transcriptional regulator [Clostridium sp.]MBS5987357.1 LysR family transcriptional regulator [Clostridium sp.]